MSDLISRTGLRRSLMIWHDRLTAAGECGAKMDGGDGTDGHE